MQILERFKGKRVAILGFATEGMATFEYLKQHGIKADIIDQMEESLFLEKHPGLGDVKLTLGADALSALNNYDIVVKTPGFSPLLPEIKSAVGKGIEFTSQIEIFIDGCPCETIGVTGTKGKGTTSTMIYEMLKEFGRDVYLGGNIGTPALAFLEQLRETSIVVLELSSFQLQVIKKSPHIAVLLNVTSEHLDYHKDTEEYRAAKSNIVKFQTKGDLAVINADYETPQEMASRAVSQKFYFSRNKQVTGCYVDSLDNIILSYGSNQETIANASETQLRGRHNLENITAACLAASLAGVPASSISEVVKRFHGLEHRLELVEEVAGVRYYNDSFSTVPETAIAALDSFEEKVVLIAGGSSKNSDYTELGKKLGGANLRAVILIGDTADEIEKAVNPKLKVPIIKSMTKMDEIVRKASELASSGDVVLLSPASASFGLFENYKDRGNQFKDAVNHL